MLEKKQCPVAYDGFEPSGRMHIAQGLLKVKNVNRLTSAGCVFVFWVADWFAMLNNKMGGDLKKVLSLKYTARTCPVGFFQQATLSLLCSECALTLRASAYINEGFCCRFARSANIS